MQRFHWNNHPFRLLLYLEWILLGIAVLTVLTPPRLPTFLRRLPPVREHIHRHLPPNRARPQLDRRLPLTSPKRSPELESPRPRRRFSRKGRFPLGVLASIGVLGLIGLRLPLRSRPRFAQGLYTGLGFGLSWLAVLLGGRGSGFFSALLLVVVIRACVLFPWRGRVLVAIAAYASFLLMLVLRIRPLGFPLISLDPLATSSQGERLEFIRRVVFTLTLNSALLFGLVLVFVLLLVSALLAEKQSRQELAQANQNLRQYALLIEDQAILQERNRIAREIHDSVGHNLTAQSIQLENTAMLLPTNVEQANRFLQKARQLGATALREVRQSVAALRSHPLQGQSLEAALVRLAQEFEQTTHIQMQSHIHLPVSLPTDVAIALYRIVQEALTNVAKHSQATQVQFDLVNGPMGIDLDLTDNGRGFSPDENTTGFGLQGMRERTQAVGGTFKLSSQPGQGCTIHIEIPQRRNHDPSPTGG